MKTYTQLYERLCSYENLNLAFEKASRGKSKKKYVLDFEKNLRANLLQLQQELLSFSYCPRKLKRFIIRDPKTRAIHASTFRDRLIHHALVNILEPIFEKIFIHDSYASRKDKGTHQAVKRFIIFMRKVSRNGRRIRKLWSNNSVQGYVLKADIRKYFDEVDHEVLLGIIGRKVKDDRVLWLVKVILDNFENPMKGKGMPLGNYTSQFFANVYLNELDYFVKHSLKAKFYIRYVDDFVILHREKKLLEHYKKRIIRYLLCLRLTLHPDKSNIISLKDGITFLGYRIFYYYRLLRKRNLRHFKKEFSAYLQLYRKGFMTKKMLKKQLQDWFGYAQWANTYKFRQQILRELELDDINASKK
ncbi:MAG: reverse transcriptase/maturase family protein [Nanoarchaeota archaeon]